MDGVISPNARSLVEACRSTVIIKRDRGIRPHCSYSREYGHVEISVMVGPTCLFSAAIENPLYFFSLLAGDN